MPAIAPRFLSLRAPRCPWIPTWGLTIATTIVTTIATALPLQAQAPATPKPISPTIQVGIRQRFGSQPQDQVTITAPPGATLTLDFETGGQPVTVTATQVQLGIVAQPLPQPEARERVVLSTHRSFESAEDSAQQWRQRGIAVEVAQPGGWEVWADRQVYNTPLLRRLLLQNLQQQGFNLPYQDSQVIRQVPKASWVVNGYRYQRDRLRLRSSNRQIQVGGTLYPGNLALKPNTYGTYTLINEVNIEDYLRGVVPHEIGPEAPVAAVEAQAILARTYALRNLRRFAIDGYELCADTQCQVYRGWTGTVGRVDRAIAATRGLVATYGNELIDALYSSTTGGVTAAFNDVWNGTPRPYLRPVLDAVTPLWDLQQRSLTQEANFRAFIAQKEGFNEVGWGYFRWEESSPLADLNRDLKAYLQKRQHPLAGFQTIQGLTVLQRSASGRVQQLQVQTDRGVLVLEKDEILRGFEAPNSILFYLEPWTEANGQLGGYRFIGGGFGHGVGLSQTGSYHLADLGWSSQNIITFYYPGTQVQPLTDALVFYVPPAP